MTRPLSVRVLMVVLVALASSSSDVHATVRDDIRSFFAATAAGTTARVSDEPLTFPTVLADIYAARDYAPIWGEVGLRHNGLTELMTAIDAGTSHGLARDVYHRSALERLRAANGASTDRVALDLLASDAFVTQAVHRAGGAVAPRTLDPDWFLPTPELDPHDMLSRIATGALAVPEALDSLWPAADEYWRLVARRAEIVASGHTEAMPVPPGLTLKPGSRDERVVRLKERLLGPGVYDPTYDDALRESVVAYQRSAGLDADGVVGANTLAVLNTTTHSWLARLDANLERWRWLPRELPLTYIRVNIAAYSLRVVDQGHDALAMDVIVGRPARRSPVFTGQISYLVFNPHWNVPHKLAVEDKMPLLRRDPAPLAAAGFEARAKDGTTFYPVDEFDWSGVTRNQFPYTLRQRPGPANALGRVKFMLPNPYSVYLHDTPSRSLFERTERSFSSGCIRLSRPLDLARWVLTRDGRKEAKEVDAIVASGESVTVHLATPLPTYLVYFTAFVDDSGDVVFRRDIYNRDTPLATALSRKTSRDG